MENQVVKKANALVKASYRLSTSEQRLILLAIARAEGKAVEQTEVIVRAEDYAKQYEVSLSAAYKALKDASEGIFERSFSYTFVRENGEIGEVKSRWVSDRTYFEKSGEVSISFAPKVLPLISQLERAFTYFELKNISGLKSQYAIRLYEILMSWRSRGEMPTISLSDLRERLGAGEKHKKLANFKCRILDLAVEQINDTTDIEVSYEQHKRGRTVSGFTFSFKLKKNSEERDPRTIDIFDGVSDGEKRKRKIITKSQAEKMAKVGESYQDLYRRLSKEFLIKE